MKNFLFFSIAWVTPTPIPLFLNGYSTPREGGGYFRAKVERLKVAKKQNKTKQNKKPWGLQQLPLS